MTHITAIPFVHDDGGRAASGYKGSTGDCVTRALAISTGIPYADAYRLVNEHAETERPRNGRKKSSARTGVNKHTTRSIFDALGWTWTPTMSIGSGCIVHLRADELPDGVVVVKLSRHVAAVVNGVLHDTYDCSRDGTRCVYGYWTQT